MQEEISLQEIIETIWNGKKIIAIVTILAMLLTGIFSFFVMKPTYQSTAMVSFSGKKDNLNSLATTIKTKSALYSLIDKLHLDKNQHTLDSLSKSINVKSIKDSNMIQIDVKGQDASFITKIANFLAYDLGIQTEIIDRSNIIVDSKNKLLALEDSIKVMQAEMDKTSTELANVPEKLITKKSLSTDAYLQSVLSDTSKVNNKDLGALQLSDEQVNPLYMSLKSKLATTAISLSSLQTQQQNLQDKVQTNSQLIAKLENSINNKELDAKIPQQIISGIQTVFITPSLIPDKPVSPRKLLNVVISAVVGLMLSTFIVFIRQYWSTPSNNINTSNKQIGT